MRRKNNLEQRLSACSECLICRLFAVDNGIKVTGLSDTGTPDKLFETFYRSLNIAGGGFAAGQDFPVWVEIGCGKGGFVNQAALLYPDVQFIAVEKNENVAITALERTCAEKIPNIRYIIGLAEYLEKIIPPACISRIFLNFSCPFPKKRHEKHRLTSGAFLEMYKRILTDDGEISFKTDNTAFFEYSVNSFIENNFLLKNISHDLHNSNITGIAGNIITEYENLFLKKGVKINYLEAIKK
ncbi:MAG: tRNA (guanosine(46)-N7)-methyltransferase TrmB [Oscillospiraceae bacterium]|nr:tRNA (guanosine(46)-N7)-methyltransferase TrmB [Oscillospiraceae bacterium]